MTDFLPSRGDEPEMVPFTSLEMGSATVDASVFKEPAALPREIADGIIWIGNCQAWPDEKGTLIHSHYSTFLILGGTRTLLVDTGPPASWPTLSAALDECLDGRGLDYVVPTHPEIPHSGNLDRVLEKYPEAVAIGEVKDLHLYYPRVADRLEAHPPGHVVDLGGGYRYEVLDAVIKDLPSTQWGYEASQQVLFVADGFSWMHNPDEEHDTPVHRPGECGRVGTGGEDFPRLRDIVIFSGFALYWTRFRDDADEVYERFERMLDDHPVSVIAPAHGNVMVDLDRIFPILRDAHRTVYRETLERA